MNNPIIQLAFAIRNNPGVFALLLGSGVSRSAAIPTGWEIVLDLIRQIAAASGEETPGDPVQWYKDRYGEEPRYDALLEKLGRTPAERNAILRAYFEPSDEDRENRIKVPQKAHKAIAWLIKQGYIKVVLTTNFDRLLETALEEVGVTPDVVSTEDALKGRCAHSSTPTLQSLNYTATTETGVSRIQKKNSQSTAPR